MTVKRTIEEFTVTFGEHIREIEFNPKIKRNTFFYERRSATGKFGIHIRQSRGGNIADLMISLAVRDDRIEEIANSPRSDLKEGGRSTWTLGAEFGNIFFGRMHRWEITTETDVAKFSREIFDEIKENAVSFFSNYGSARAILDALAKNDRKAMTLCPFPYVRATRTIAAAIEVGISSTKIKELVEMYESYFKEVLNSDYDHVRFQQFIKNLAEIKVLTI